jgi:hypothetical protein
MIDEDKVALTFVKGGKGSGHKGHAGRPGKHGGSAPGSGGGGSSSKPKASSKKKRKGGSGKTRSGWDKINSVLFRDVGIGPKNILKIKHALPKRGNNARYSWDELNTAMMNAGFGARFIFKVSRALAKRNKEYEPILTFKGCASDSTDKDEDDEDEEEEEEKEVTLTFTKGGKVRDTKVMQDAQVSKVVHCLVVAEVEKARHLASLKRRVRDQ